ncbi:MAG: SCO family protein [Verrucomicrobiota bacterium]
MENFATRYLASVLVLCSGLAGCDRAEQSDAGARHYEARGIVRGFAPDRSTIDVEHEEIPGFMPSMTMPFSVKDSKQIAGFNIGDAISFRLTVTERDSWIDQIKNISVDKVRLPAATATPSPVVNASVRLREGDVMPPFELTDQDGHNINLRSFRGHPFVLTFIFTRCPIPNFCPLMSKNFAALQVALEAGSAPLAQTRLLTISFDPEFDSPQVLKAYAEHEHADPRIWAFATGDKSEIEDLTHEFSVYVQAEGGAISHGLATALVDRNGKIIKIWRGNSWTPGEVVREVEAHND